MIDALPQLESPYHVADEDVAAFQRDGHVLLRGVLPPDAVERVRPPIVDAAFGRKTETRPLAERDTYGKAFLQMENLWRTHPDVRPFVLSPRFGAIAARLLGVDAVRIYHDQALFKEPGGGATPWHQDQVYWPLDNDKTVTMWMPLIDVPEEVGSMTFASGSHLIPRAKDVVISDESEAAFDTFVAEHGLRLTTYGAMRAGDATFHAGWTIHRAGANPTSTMREVMTVIYFADGTRALEPDRPERANDLRNWLGGITPGELAASEFNPLVGKAG
ncbi:MAG: phytanoyl-CoA dioxygenase family protein [Candidatus Eremiobacteraeota bacterium]|nr:phytanoyl-CoA dioxygenase family protein [Candidatus Eremiobacteraeota bacterium]